MNQLLRNAPIGVKVSLAPAFAIVCLVVVAVVGWLSNQSLTRDLRSVGGNGVERVAQAGRYATQLTELHQGVYQSLTWEAVGQRAEAIKALDDRLLGELEAFEKTLRDAGADATLRDDERDALRAIAEGFAGYRKIAADTLDIKTAGVATATSYVVTLDNEYQANQALIAAFAKATVVSAQDAVAAAEAAGARNAALIAAVALVAMALSGALVWLFSRMIADPLGDAARTAGSLAQGDLTVRPADTSADATGRVLAALQDVSRSLSGIVREVRATADEIKSASGEIASGNADLSARTESTASALQQTAASIEELSTTIRLSADNARQADQLARGASQVALEGGEAVADVVRTMDEINAQAQKIGEIIGTIDGIAFQTNILALNAAVEAARAGEHGRGFSVVAQEVRNLAQRSSDASKEIRALISSSVQKIGTGADKVQAAGETMRRIVDSIQKVSVTVADISRAAEEQASGITQVNEAVAEMDRSTQQNAAMVEQAAAATDSLRGQAERLVHLLARFRTA